MTYKLRCRMEAEAYKYHFGSLDKMIDTLEQKIPELTIAEVVELDKDSQKYKIKGTYETEVEASDDLSAWDAANDKWVHSDFSSVSWPVRSDFLYVQAPALANERRNERNRANIERE